MTLETGRVCVCDAVQHSEKNCKQTFGSCDKNKENGRLTALAGH